jgi:hypothetical protein
MAQPMWQGFALHTQPRHTGGKLPMRQPRQFLSRMTLPFVSPAMYRKLREGNVIVEDHFSLHASHLATGKSHGGSVVEAAGIPHSKSAPAFSQCTHILIFCQCVSARLDMLVKVATSVQRTSILPVPKHLLLPVLNVFLGNFRTCLGNQVVSCASLGNS